jgi:hypothetical protein
MFQRIQQLLIDPRTNQRTPTLSRSHCNLFCTTSEGRYLAGYREHGNPFDADSTRIRKETPVPSLQELPDPQMQRIHDLFATYCGTSHGKNTGLVPKTFVAGVLPWSSRLLLVVRKLPALAEDACNIFSNIFDLYTTTIFRICAGSAQHERILLGVEKHDAASSEEQSVNQGSSKAQKTQIPSSPLFRFRRRSSSSLKSTSKRFLRSSSLSAYTEAEICAPLPSERKGIGCLRNLIIEGQQKLQGIAKLALVDNWVVDPPKTPTTKSVTWACQAARTLEQRQVAMWSSIFLATALHSVGRLANERLELSYTATLSSSGSSLERYIDSYLEAAPVLVRLLNRISCIRALRGKDVIQEVRLQSIPSCFVLNFQGYTQILPHLCHVDGVLMER